MQINKNRELITLEQTLAYIKYINREKPFNKQEIIIPTKDYEELIGVGKQKAPTPREKPKKLKIDDIEDQDLTKKINKNRAIKRIIESAFEILQGFKIYQEDQIEEKGDKSSELQFNIYLKQYNRVLEMIYKRQIGRLNLQAEKAEQREQILQNIYEYTVVQDFRQILPIAILKDKISKNNVQIMINALSDSLVVLKPNELRLFDSKDGTGNYKTMKLHEIENVDYHTQPYIFIVITIQKDKQRFNIYMKFQSEKNQEKWDRALYCCYVGRKMKTKQKFFLIQYPEDDVKKKEKEQTKKLAAFNYEAQAKKTPIERIFLEGRTMSISSRKQIQDEALSKSNRKMSISKSIIKNTSKEEIEEIPSIERTGTEIGMKGTILNSNKYTLINQSGLDIQKSIKPANDELINRNKTDFIKISNSKQLQTPNQRQNTEFSKNFSNLFPNQEIRKKPSEEFQQSPFQKQSLPEDIRRVHDIERKNIKGIILQKQKFFFNKAKILYLKENREANQKLEKDGLDIQSQYQAMMQRELEYWDFNSGSGEKTERKIIKLPNIKKYEIQEDKYLTIIHEGNKQIKFSGDILLMNEVFQWISLIQNIYRTKLLNPITVK